MDFRQNWKDKKDGWDFEDESQIIPPNKPVEWFPWHTEFPEVSTDVSTEPENSDAP